MTAPPPGGWASSVRSCTRIARAPLVPELELHLAQDMEATWAGLQEELADDALAPPYWAFAWLGGQALARYVLDAPHEVAGRRVLDLATGSGLCALAARLAGGQAVEAVDVDPMAVAAARLNAERNGLDVQVERKDLLVAAPPPVDVVLAGDVFYDASMAERVQPWLLEARRQGASVLVGDPGRSYLPRALLSELAAYEVSTTRALEGAEVRTARAYALR